MDIPRRPLVAARLHSAAQASFSFSFDCLDDPGGHPRHDHIVGNVFRHHRSTRHNGVFADGHTGHYRHTAAEPGVFLDVNGLAAQRVVVMKIMVCGHDVCRSCSGRPASEWITGYAMQEMQRMLKDPALTLTEISDRMRFPNYPNFTKYAKSNLGMSPSEYRQRLEKRPRT